MERGRIIVNNTDYTGSFVTPNPSEPPTKDLNTLEIEGEVFNIAGSGGGGVGDITNYYGVFIDTNNIIQPFVHITDTAEHAYVATEDCAVAYYIPNDTNTDVYIKLDGVIVGGQYGQYINATSGIVYMKKGQVFSYQTTYTVSIGAGYTVYGLQSGDRIPTLIQDAQIYSEDERVVGVWIDNKPLYQKTIPFGSLPNYSLKTLAHNIANIDKVISYEGIVPSGTIMPYVAFSDWSIGLYVDKVNINVQTRQDWSDITESYVTIQYTKTTDEEGSGGYQAYGMSPAIYSTKEREIGVWIDNKPLYQKTFEKSISVTSTSRTWYTVITSSELRAIDADKIFIETSDSYIEDSDGLYEVNYSSIVGNAGRLMGGVYDKKTDVIQLCIAGVAAGTKTAKITIKYTKTTDSPKRTGYELLDIQENQIIVDGTRYSTEEKIIGTWIDDKPLYQKTFVISSIPSNSYDYYNFASNVDKVINYQGMVIDTSSDASMNICYVRPDNTNTQFYTQILADKRFFFRTYTSWTASAYITFCYTKTTDAVGSGGYQAYGFSPIIYSEEEREIGVWTDNKPLYQKTWVFSTPITLNANTWFTTTIDHTALSLDKLVNAFANSGEDIYNGIQASTGTGSYIEVLNYRYAQFDTLTLQYTKTTDVAGSGEYNTLGVPNVHYDGNERVIGTWFGETLYEKIINFDYNDIQSSTSSGCEIYINVPDIKDTKDSVILFEGGTIQFPYFVSTSIFIGGFAQTETDTFHISLRYSSSVYSELNAYLTDCRVKLQYTKTS